MSLGRCVGRGGVDAPRRFSYGLAIAMGGTMRARAWQLTCAAMLLGPWAQGCGSDADDGGDGTTFESVPNCIPEAPDAELFGVGASPGEDGHLMAVYFDPWDVDVEVTAVDYRVGSGLDPRDPQDPTLPHDVVLFTSPRPEPPARPTFLATQRVMPPTDVSLDRGRFVGPVELDAPVVVPAGTYLFLATEMRITEEGRQNAINTCDNREGLDDTRGWWSNAPRPTPDDGFPWAPLSDFGLEVSTYARVVAEPVQP